MKEIPPYTQIAKDMKRCCACSIAKPRTEFYQNFGTSDGLTSRCKDCSKKFSKERIEKIGYRKYNRMRREKDYEKIKVNEKLRSAVQSGKVIKKPCVICSKPDTQGHHFDYSKPLEVIWLCSEHHALIHVEGAYFHIT